MGIVVLYCIVKLQNQLECLTQYKVNVSADIRIQEVGLKKIIDGLVLVVCKEVARSKFII